MSYRRVQEEIDELSYSLVTRYGPRTNYQRKSLSECKLRGGLLNDMKLIKSCLYFAKIKRLSLYNRFNENLQTENLTLAVS